MLTCRNRLNIKCSPVGIGSCMGGDTKWNVPIQYITLMNMNIHVNSKHLYPTVIDFCIKDDEIFYIL